MSQKTTTGRRSEEVRVQKFLSSAGVCSRRTAEQWMEAGYVKINGKVCRELGTKIVVGRDRVEVKGRLVSAPENRIYLLVNKPANYITSLYDPEGRPIITDLLPESMPRVWPVGRLDYHSEGLLLLTNDGELTHLLTHPSHLVDKHYVVKVQGILEDDAELLEELRAGVELGDGEVTQPAFVRVTGHTERNTWLEMIIAEGRNRQIRRMFEVKERMVMKLRRVRLGPLTLEGTPQGSYRSLSSQEVYDLYAALEAEVPREAQPSKRKAKRERQDGGRRPQARRARNQGRGGRGRGRGRGRGSRRS